MKKFIFSIFFLIELIAGNPVYAGIVPPTAKYYFTTGSVAGDPYGCSSVTFSGWDGQFRRVGNGAEFLLGLVTYQNRTCTGAPLDIAGSFQVNFYLEEPTFEVVTDPLQCEPFLTCSVETGKRIVGNVTGQVPYSLKLTNNTGNPDSDADGATFPTSNKPTLWVKENESASFFLTASYNSPIEILSIIPASSNGWVTAGTDPLGDRIFPSQSDLEILSLANVDVQVPEPTSIALLGVGFLVGVIRHRKVRQNR